LNASRLPRFKDVFAEVRRRLSLTQTVLARRTGTSRRTLVRWEAGERVPAAKQLRALVEVVSAVDPASAKEIAASQGQTLESLGLVRLAASAQATPPFVVSMAVDAVLCTLAEALDTSPRALRPALLAAVRRMRELGLTLEMIDEAMG
jgi:transcriptional regulator with XRE-family HTH domain